MMPRKIGRLAVVLLVVVLSVFLVYRYSARDASVDTDAPVSGVTSSDTASAASSDASSTDEASSGGSSSIAPSSSVSSSSKSSAPVAASSNAPSADSSSGAASAQSQPTAGPTAEASIQFMGDLLLHETVTNSAMTGVNTYDFSPYLSLISPYFTGNMVICNLESPVDCNQDNTAISAYPLFNIPHEAVTNARDAGINTFVTANNHAFDMGWKGIVSTRKYLTDAGVGFTGTYETQAQYDDLFVKDVNGIKVGLIAYTAFLNGNEGKVPADQRALAIRTITQNPAVDIPRILAEVQALRDKGAEFIIVSFHWGVEYQDVPSAAQKAIAEGLIDGGVDVVMGNHPHCVQPIVRRTAQFQGKTKDGLIMYSLGNFFADQSVMMDKTEEGLIVSIKIQRDAEGTVRIADANAMPTLTYKMYAGTAFNGQNKFTYRVAPAGKYAAEGVSPPDVFISSAADFKQKDAAAWTRVQSVVGNQITYVTG